MKKASFFFILVSCAALLAPAHAAGQAEEVLKAIVKIRAVIPEGARTAAALGTEREGHGIVLDSKGHILTTGYLIIESESIEVTGPDGKKVKAAFVGYDHATGFGILRTESALNVEPLKLGNSSDLKEGAPVIVAGHGGRESAIGARVVARRLLPQGVGRRQRRCGSHVGHPEGGGDQGGLIAHQRPQQIPVDEAKKDDLTSLRTPFGNHRRDQSILDFTNR